MSYRNMFSTYVGDLAANIAILNSLVSMYNLSITGVGQMSNINGMSKKNIDKATDRMKEIGYLVDDFIEICESSINVYSKYCSEKDSLMDTYFCEKNIYIELQEEIRQST